MLERVCLVHYHEIGLKGRNRATFERRLQSNLDAALAGFPVRQATLIASRLIVGLTDAGAATKVAERIAMLPGVNSVLVAVRTGKDMSEIESAAVQVVEESGATGTFRVNSRRSNTDFVVPSLEVNRLVGSAIQKATLLPVDLSHPDLTVEIEIVQGEAYVSAFKLRGAGGLPAGSAGRVISLLSAGIDSPVATWRMMRRGAVAVGIHFSGRPQTNDLSERLVVELGHVLEQTGGLGRIYMVPFGDLQKEISLASPPDLRVLIYRRLMVRIAEEVARVERAKALVTGESLGQVASQTLENIAVVDDAANLPVLRPLIGSDKLEIIAEARRIGTYELSTQDHTDCCTLFMPRTPETHARLGSIQDAWAELDVDRMVQDGLNGLSWADFSCPVYRAPKRWPSGGVGS